MLLEWFDPANTWLAIQHPPPNTVQIQFFLIQLFRKSFQCEFDSLFFDQKIFTHILLMNDAHFQHNRTVLLPLSFFLSLSLYKHTKLDPSARHPEFLALRALIDVSKIQSFKFATDSIRDAALQNGKQPPLPFPQHIRHTHLWHMLFAFLGMPLGYDQCNEDIYILFCISSITY
jgi:hypothetical protein